MSQDMAGEDASLDASVAAIAAKLRGGAGSDVTQDTRANRTDRDTTEQDDYTDLEDLERIERDERAQAQAKPTKSAEAQTKGNQEGQEGEDATADEEAYIELPAAEEGAEPERIKAKDAAEAFKQIRQMNGDIAQAVIRAQDEAQQKNEAVHTQLLNELSEARRTINVLMRTMPVPQPPHRELLNPNSQYYNPEAYHTAKIAYDDHMALIAEAQRGEQQLTQQQQKAMERAAGEYVERENERVSRYIPEWKDETSRETYRTAMAESLAKHYGITEAEMNGLPFSHKFIRLAADALKAKETPVRQAEVRKQLQEKVVKVVKGQSQQNRDMATGRFTSDARKELRETGSEAAMAKWLMSSGALKGL